MSFWSRIAAFALRKAGPEAVGSELFGILDQWGITGAGVPVNSFTAMQHVAVMACVSILSEDVAKLPLQIYRRLDKGGKEIAYEHPLYPVLQQPNEWQTQFEFIEMMQAALVLRGNAYAVMIRDGRGRITSFVPVHPDRVTLYEAPGGDYFFMVTRQGLHEMAVLGDLPILIHHEDMLHLRWLSGWSSLLGQSRIGLMREAVGLGISLEQQAARFTAQGARPGGALQTDKSLSPDAIARIKASWQEAQGGWRNAGKTVVLEEGLKWQPLGMTMVDADFIAQRRLQLEDIARGFRVPLYKVGVPSEGGGPSMSQQDQEYLNTSIVSYTTRWTSKIAKIFDLDPRQYFVEFDYEEHFKADLLTRYTAARIGIIGGFKTHNEIRRREGDPDDPKGNTLLQPTNMAPLGWVPPDKGAGPGSDETGAPAAGGNGDALRLPEI